jgi:hypothetical protein
LPARAQIDPKYAIVQECMPYMSRRLLSDNNPRMRAALRQLLYGSGSRLDVPRLSRMLASFNDYTTDGNGTEGVGGSDPYALDRYSADAPVISESVKDVIRVVFSKEGTFAQEVRWVGSTVEGGQSWECTYPEMPMSCSRKTQGRSFLELQCKKVSLLQHGLAVPSLPLRLTVAMQ